MFLELKNNIIYFTDEFLNLIYKEKCLVCSCAKTNELLCKTCAIDVHYLSSFAQRIYKNCSLYSALIYDGSVKKLIQMLKFSHRKKAAKVLSSMLFRYFKKLDLKDDFIICFPANFYLKQAQRGYNHMFLIAQEFSKLTGFEIKKDLIKKIKHTKPQYKARNRHKNIKGSFKINEKYLDEIKNKNILLIDDITTSGATLEEIIDCFLNLGINNITALTIAKAGK